MILDTVLEEQSFDKDQMIDMFIEGYLAACEVIDNNIKFENIEEMTEVLEETALQSINELSSKLANKAAKKAEKMGKGINDEANKIRTDMSQTRAKLIGSIVPHKTGSSTALGSKKGDSMRLSNGETSRLMSNAYHITDIGKRMADDMDGIAIRKFAQSAKFKSYANRKK